MHLSSPSEALEKAEAAARELGADTKRIVFFAVCTGDGSELMKRGWIAGKRNYYQPQFPPICFVQGKLAGEEKVSGGQEAYHISGWPHRFVIGPDRTLRASYGSSG